MNDDATAMLIVLPVAGLIFLTLGIGSVLIIRDTARKSGRWGINTKQVYCPECDEPAPVVRIPKNLHQMLWGGCTCEECGLEYDKWGKPVLQKAPER
jgi:hypothetical protein